jgi:hypothetical protein
MAIEVGQAVDAARKTAAEFFPAATDLRLEEIETPEGKGEWLITVSFLLPKPKSPANIIAPELFPQFERVYKIFSISEDTGKVRAMKIRAT